MYKDVRKRVPAGAGKVWSRPAVRRLAAGSAELNVSGASDGPNQVS